MIKTSKYIYLSYLISITSFILSIFNLYWFSTIGFYPSYNNKLHKWVPVEVKNILQGPYIYFIGIYIAFVIVFSINYLYFMNKTNILKELTPYKSLNDKKNNLLIISTAILILTILYSFWVYKTFT